MHLILFFFLITGSLFAEMVEIDRSAKSYALRQQNRQRIEVFDFSGDFPELENIDIDGRRKKNVEIKLTGNYPVLESINYIGSFGVLSGALTGSFPELRHVCFSCTDCAMNFDFTGEWKRSCSVTIRGQNEEIVLKLPKEIGIVIHTSSSLKGKVVLREDLKKQKFLSVLNKTYQNSLAETAPIVLTLRIEAQDARIVLN